MLGCVISEVHESEFSAAILPNQAALIDGRFDAVDRRFEKVDERFQGLDQKVGKVSDRAIHLQWMVGIAIILALIALGKQFWPLIDAVVPK